MFWWSLLGCQGIHSLLNCWNHWCLRHVCLQWQRHHNCFQLTWDDWKNVLKIIITWSLFCWNSWAIPWKRGHTQLVQMLYNQGREGFLCLKDNHVTSSYLFCFWLPCYLWASLTVRAFTVSELLSVDCQQLTSCYGFCVPGLCKHYGLAKKIEVTCYIIGTSLHHHYIILTSLVHHCVVVINIIVTCCGY